MFVSDHSKEKAISTGGCRNRGINVNDKRATDKQNQAPMVGKLDKGICGE